MLKSYLPALVFVALGTGVGGLFTYLNAVLGPRRPSRVKSEPYECGLPSEVTSTFRFGISFYLIAMLFILFDIEVVFLYPVAVGLRAFGTFALVETIVFIVLLFVAFVYVWRRGELEGADLDQYVQDRIGLTTLEKAQNWARANAPWPLTFGLACCAIEMISVVGSPRMDAARFGAEVFRASPRQADMIILSGRVSIKMAPVIRRIYDQMLEPKWVIAMGACSSSAGMFNNYALVQGADKFMPVDIYVPGCPPRPEALIYGINKLQKMIWERPDLGWRERYKAQGTEEGARPPAVFADFEEGEHT